MAFDPSNGNNAYAGANAQGFYRSLDGGQTFFASNNGLGNLQVWAIAISPANPAVVYAGTSNGVFRSADRGANWQPAGLSGQVVRALAVHPQNANQVYAGLKNERVWLTNNGGASWQNASAGIPVGASVYAFSLDATQCNALLAGGSRGVYRLSLSAPVATPTPTATAPTPTATPTATATPPGQTWVTITSENFEGPFPRAGWQVADNQSGAGEYYWGKRACRPFSGSYSGWAVGAGADGQSLGCGANYANNTFSWLIYGPFSLVDAADAELLFQRWYNSEPGYDIAFWGASLDGEDFSGVARSGNGQNWLAENFDLTNVYQLGDLRGQPNVWIAFVFDTDESVTYPEGFYVDDIVLRKQTGDLAAGLAAPAAGNPACADEAGQPDGARQCTTLSLLRPARPPR